jgi:hypothetical protein
VRPGLAVPELWTMSPETSDPARDLEARHPGRDRLGEAGLGPRRRGQGRGATPAVGRPAVAARAWGALEVGKLKWAAVDNAVNDVVRRLT